MRASWKFAGMRAPPRVTVNHNSQPPLPSKRTNTSLACPRHTIPTSSIASFALNRTTRSGRSAATRACQCHSHKSPRPQAGGTTGQWNETLQSLCRKSASQRASKHCPNTLRKPVNKNNLPGMSLEKRTWAGGKNILFTGRAEKRVAVKATARNHRSHTARGNAGERAGFSESCANTRTKAARPRYRNQNFADLRAPSVSFSSPQFAPVRWSTHAREEKFYRPQNPIEPPP